jgi:hypothetical protein
MPKARKFNAALLSEVIARDGATLIGEYSTLNSSVKISYRCKCGAESSKQFSVLVHGCYATCKSCSGKAGNERLKATMLENYGVDNPLKSPIIKEKVRNTVLQKYGVPCVFQSIDIKQKIEETLISAYGVKNPFQSDIIKDKIKATNLDKYGCENAMQNTELQKKLETTSQQRYGTRRPSENTTVRSKIQLAHQQKSEEERDQIRQKVIETSLERYGVSSPNQSAAVKQNKKTSCVEKYGVEYPMQSSIIQEIAQQRAMKHKQYIMPSGAVRMVQGYEPYALTELLTLYTEEQIVTGRTFIPRIEYTDSANKHRYHFPDIFLPHINTLIEVKSTWTYNCTSDNIKEKAEAAVVAGYNYELWVFNGKGERTHCEKFKS